MRIYHITRVFSTFILSLNLWLGVSAQQSISIDWKINPSAKKNTELETHQVLSPFQCLDCFEKLSSDNEYLIPYYTIRITGNNTAISNVKLLDIKIEQTNSEVLHSYITENFEIENLDKRMYKYIFNTELFISAYHKKGLDVLENLLKKLSKKSSNENDKKSSIVIVGRPNAGKSTLFNALLNSNRSTVSNVPGTTRDKINEDINLNTVSYQITDTAGIPRKKQKNQIDMYSSIVAIRSLENATLALIVIDSEVGLSFEDKRILKEAIEQNVTPLVVFNKWDKLDIYDKEEINNNIKNELKQYQWVNVLRISALNKKNITQISKSIKDIEDQLHTRIGTSELNIKFRELWIKNPPHPFRGKRAKLKYVTQYSSYPPEFSFNLSSRIPKNYQKFIENNIRKNFNMKNICFKVKINA